ncbi:hypothetical protein VTO42DRAFT_8019 [Malbranchea cinnamomea]
MFSQRSSTGLSQLQDPPEDSEPQITPPVSSGSHSTQRQPAAHARLSPGSSRPRSLTNQSKSLRTIHTSSPASPPTPAPSPTPHQHGPSWQTPCDDEEAFIRETTTSFGLLSKEAQRRLLAQILDRCDSRQLGFVQQYVGPMLKRDPFKVLPNELCLRILSFIDDPKTLARAARVSVRWYELLTDDITWKMVYDKHTGALTSQDYSEEPSSLEMPPGSSSLNKARPPSLSISQLISPSKAAEEMAQMRSGQSRSLSYRTRMKRKYMVDAAWKKGGTSVTRYVTNDQGVVVTNLHLTQDHILVALDNAKIYVFGRNGEHQRILQGHIMGVWATVPYKNILVSGGCDRDVRVWDIETGQCKHRLRGHTSTVRCLKMVNASTAISGSRDGTLRIWDIEMGRLKRTLSGHSASVRCLEVHGDLVVSGSYDTTAKLWSISQERCLRTMSGHFSQIYAVAFDGKRIATGSLDTSVRIWDPATGNCQAILQGHTSLVGQLQMKGNTLVTGGSDGSIRVWSLEKFAPIHRLAAHDNSITSLQFDGHRIMSGGSDGRVRIWDAATGQPVRELGQPAESVWRVGFEAERAVIMATRQGRMVMEVWSFAPPPEALRPRLNFGRRLPESRSTTYVQDVEMVNAF